MEENWGPVCNPQHDYQLQRQLKAQYLWASSFLFSFYNQNGSSAWTASQQIPTFPLFVPDEVDGDVVNTLDNVHTS